MPGFWTSAMMEMEQQHPTKPCRRQSKSADGLTLRLMAGVEKRRPLKSNGRGTVRQGGVLNVLWPGTLVQDVLAPIWDEQPELCASWPLPYPFLSLSNPKISSIIFPCSRQIGHADGFHRPGIGHINSGAGMHFGPVKEAVKCLLAFLAQSPPGNSGDTR